MTQEDKELLLKDLCARLPYNVYTRRYVYITPTDAIESVELFHAGWLEELCAGEAEFKPYLFPLSSMTEEQEKEFNDLYYRYHESAFIFNERFSCDRWSIKDIGFYPCYLQDWLNKNNFDYRGLIPKGLANDATGKNIYKL